MKLIGIGTLNTMWCSAVHRDERFPTLKFLYKFSSQQVLTVININMALCPSGCLDLITFIGDWRELVKEREVRSSPSLNFFTSAYSHKQPPVPPVPVIHLRIRYLRTSLLKPHIYFIYFIKNYTYE